MIFFVGLHVPSAARHFARACISVNRVRGRRSPVPCQSWIMDSGAFTELSIHGRYRHGPEEYAAEVNRLAALNPGLEVAVSQDWMCEPWIVEKTGLSVAEHQRRTIEWYDALLGLIRGPALMPVLQGYRVEDYLDHVAQYGARLRPGMLVSVGSVCKRNGVVAQIEAVLSAIHLRRPDLRLHGFGVKTTALGSGIVRECLYSADSIAWSFAARRQGRDPNDWREAAAFAAAIDAMPVQNAWAF